MARPCRSCRSPAGDNNPTNTLADPIRQYKAKVSETAKPIAEASVKEVQGLMETIESKCIDMKPAPNNLDEEIEKPIEFDGRPEFAEAPKVPTSTTGFGHKRLDSVMAATECTDIMTVAGQNLVKFRQCAVGINKKADNIAALEKDLKA